MALDYRDYGEFNQGSNTCSFRPVSSETETPFPKHKAKPLTPGLSQKPLHQHISSQLLEVNEN